MEQTDPLWLHIIGRNAHNRLFGLVVRSVECEACLPRNNLQRSIGRVSYASLSRKFDKILTPDPCFPRHREPPTVMGACMDAVRD
jgi:hypothetical protein